MKDLYQLFTSPPKEFSQLPWWFWNDEITEEGIKEQLADFRDKGLFGFTIQARMGLSKNIPYLGERWFEFVKFAVDEASRHGMIVHLYDEGMYPSGSAHGEVANGHPEYLARGLEMRKIEPLEKLILGEQEKCIAIMPEGQNEAIPFEQAEIDFSKPYYAFVITLSGGTIRGVHEGEDDRQNAPKASDLLNPLAIKRFIELTHERYYQTLKEHFGNTVQAIFTDEPNIMGRGAKSGLRHWTDGLEIEFKEEKGYDIVPFLPALWNDIGEKTAQIRKDHSDVVAKRFNDSFYQQISDWCTQHNIALTGHPAESDDIGPLKYFQLPGQDMVWRYIEPEKPSALEGRHSTAGKCSSSSARHQKARRNGNELYGAYGWKLNMDEMKWLADWFLVRGVNLFWPHAFYYTIRDFRAYERPPDLGRNNLWWKYYRIFADYTSRLCWLLTDSKQICDVAILGTHDHLPWQPAKALFQNQIDFNYLEDRLINDAKIADGRIFVGDASYSVIILTEEVSLSKSEQDILLHFMRSGGNLIRYPDNAHNGYNSVFIDQIAECINRDIIINPPNNNLRYVHLIKDGYNFYYLTNEGGEAIDGKLALNCVGHAEWWDPLTGKNTLCPIIDYNRNSITIPLHLEKREGIILAIDTSKKPILEHKWQPRQVIEQQDISDGWKIYDTETGKILSDRLIDWLEIPDCSKFSGTLIYERELEANSDMLDNGLWILNLGDVHDFAEVYCNDTNCGVRLWSPFEFRLNFRLGKNILRIYVTNSLANKYDKESIKSGILGQIFIIKEN